MTARDKAKELVEKYNDYTKAEYVIQLTLTVVDEILKLPFENQSERNYWQEVKTEINKL